MLKIIAIAASLVLNGQLVDQGAPGRQGPWPVYIQLLPDGGGGGSGGGIIPAYPDGGALCPFAVTYPDGGIVFYVGCDFSLNYSVGPLYPDGGSFPFYVDTAGNIGGGPQLTLNSNGTAFAAISAATIVDGGAALPGLDMTAVGSSLDGQFYWTGTGWQTPQWLYVDAGEPVATQGELDAGLKSITPGGWATAFDCDFSAQGSQTLSGDGTYTICGQTFHKQNSANEQSNTLLVSGTGIEIFPATSGTGAYACGTRTAPLLWVALDPLIPNFTNSTLIRISYAVKQSNVYPDAGGSGHQMLFGGLEGNASSNNAVIVGQQYNSGVYNYNGACILAGGSLGNGATSTDNDFVIITSGASISYAQATMYSGVYDGGFPAWDSLQAQGISPGATTQNNNISAMPKANTWDAVIGAGSNLSSHANEAIFTRLKIEYEP